MVRVYAIQDNDSHWYVIPANCEWEFVNDLESGSEDFDTRWSKYRTGGDLNNIQLYAEI